MSVARFTFTAAEWRKLAAATKKIPGTKLAVREMTRAAERHGLSGEFGADEVKVLADHLEELAVPVGVKAAIAEQKAYCDLLDAEDVERRKRIRAMMAGRRGE